MTKKNSSGHLCVSVTISASIPVWEGGYPLIGVVERMVRFTLEEGHRHQHWENQAAELMGLQLRWQINIIFTKLALAHPVGISRCKTVMHKCFCAHEILPRHNWISRADISKSLCGHRSSCSLYFQEDLGTEELSPA